ncbi:MAG: YdcF family protein [Lachnospiraceae bacterium]|nr:YdcF family protein [Lachnospiraceae bacterium]
MGKKERLIPREKSKNVIYLDKRGYTGRRKTIPAVLFGLIALAAFIYCVVIALFMGYGTKFFLIWGVVAAFFAGLSYLMLRPDIMGKISKWLKLSFLTVCIVGVLIFAAIEGMIIGSFDAVPSPGADYCIILGAQWKDNGPSYVLQKRLDAAVSYLTQNEGTIAIVSGGQGENEPISEAEGMKEYLINAGIAEDRIIVEDASANTNENLLNCGELIDRDNDRVVLVTNNFHVFRACSIAKRQGYQHIEGLAAASYPAMLPNNLLREFMGVIKDSVMGNM